MNTDNITLIDLCSHRGARLDGRGGRPVKRGMRLYIAAFALLLRGPATVRELATACGMRLTPNMRTAIKGLHSGRLVRIAGWKSGNGRGGAPCSVWALGSEPDVQPTLYGGRMPARARIGLEMLAFIEAMRCLQAGCASTLEIADASGMSRRQAQNFVRELRLARAAHITAWEHFHQTPAAVYAFGPGRDAPRPVPTEKRAIELRYYQKAKAKRRQVDLLRALAGTHECGMVA